MSAKEESWQQFLAFCEKLQDKKRFQEFFDLFFTYEEKDDLAKRYEVVRALLQENIPQREIAEKYSVSIFKVTRGSNALKIVKPRFKEFLTKEIL